MKRTLEDVFEKPIEPSKNEQEKSLDEQAAEALLKETQEKQDESSKEKEIEAIPLLMQNRVPGMHVS